MVPSPGFSQDQQGLLTIKRAIINWDAYYRRSQCTGWSEQPGADVCTWTGVACRNGNVVLVRFANNGFQHHGACINAPAWQLCPRVRPAAHACMRHALRAELALNL